MEKRSLGVQCSRDCTPAAGPTPPRPKQPVVWGTGKKVVYGYSSIQRGDSGTKYVRAHLTPHRLSQQCFSLPSLATEGGKKQPGGTVSPRLYPRRTENIFVPGPTPPRPKQPVVWGTGKKVVYGYSSIQRGILGQTMLGPISPLTEPPSSVFHSPLCKLGLLVRTSKGSGHAHHPRRPGTSLTFMQEHRF